MEFFFVFYFVLELNALRRGPIPGPFCPRPFFEFKCHFTILPLTTKVPLLSHFFSSIFESFLHKKELHL